MIKKIVHTYWNIKGEENFSGFASFKDLLASTTLSCLLAKERFEEIELITNDFGKEVFCIKLGLPYTSVNTILNTQYKLNPLFWAYCKLISYSIQEKPFLHIDSDVFLIKKPTDEFLKGKLCFQQIEAPFTDNNFYCWGGVAGGHAGVERDPGGRKRASQGGLWHCRTRLEGGVASAGRLERRGFDPAELTWQ